MVRNSKEKDRISYNKGDVEKALAKVKSGESLRSACKTFNVPFTTLRRAHKKYLGLRVNVN